MRSNSSESSTSQSALVKFMETPMVRFAGVGVISTLADILVFKTLYSHLISNVYVATALGFLVGLTIGFLLNGRLVFKQEYSHERYLKYFVTSFGGLLITEGIIHLLYKDLHVMSSLEAKLVAVAIVFFWNFGWSKYWTFK